MVDNRENGINSRSVVKSGWSSAHSWIFIIIVAIGLIITGYLNRYEYFGSDGKAYRVSKISGAIYEYNPIQGWIVANFAEASQQMASNMETPEPMTPPPTPVNPPTTSAVPVETPDSLEENPTASNIDQPEEQQGTALIQPVEQTPEVPETTTETEEPENAEERDEEMSVENRYKAFLQLNPGYGEEEFKLANETLYPHWKETINPDGNFIEFLSVYKKFTQWWIDAGAPREPGFQLWKRFLTETNIGANIESQ